MVGIVVLVGMVVVEGKKGGGSTVGVGVGKVRGTQARYATSVVMVCVPEPKSTQSSTFSVKRERYNRRGRIM